MRDPEFQDNFDPTLGKTAKGSGKVPGNVWKNLSRLMEVVLYALAMLVVWKMFGPEYAREERMQAELEDKTRILKVKEVQVARLRLEHKLLKTDKEYLETISRDRLNMQKEGEYIIRIKRD